MGGLFGGAKGMLAPLSNYLGGGGGGAACPPSSYASILFLRLCTLFTYSDGKAYGEAHFGAANNSVHILLDNVECSGKEDTIADCARSDWLKHDCEHSEDAGVVCSDGDNRDTISDATSLANTFSTSTQSTRTSASSVSTTTVVPTPETNIGKFMFIQIQLSMIR